MNFKIELAGNRYKPQQVTALYLITAFALLGTGAITFLLGNTDWVQKVFHAPVLPATLTGSLATGYALLLFFLCLKHSKWLQHPGNNRVFRIINSLVTGILCIIFLVSQWWLAAGTCGLIAAANLFAFFYEQKASHPLTVVFDETAVYLPASSRRKQLEWSEVERVLLRHGTITIDCSNNFLYQWNIRHAATNAAELEAFCKEQVEKNRDKRVTDW
jgi:hypothetical protein